MRLVIKFVLYTEVRTHKKGDFLETVQVWRLQKQRKPSECGVWLDGKKIKGYEQMIQDLKIIT